MTAASSRVVVWLQYAATGLGWHTIKHCPICRDMRLIRKGKRACRQCRRDPDAARDAVTLNIFRHMNQRRTR